MADDRTVVAGDQRRTTTDTVDIAEYLVGLGTAAAHQGDYLRALAAVRESISLFHWEGDLYRTAQGVAVVARVAQDTGHFERAAHLLGAVAALRRDFPAEFLWVEPVLHAEYERCLPLTRAAMGEAAFAAAYAEGQHMTPEQAVAYALEGDQANGQAQRNAQALTFTISKVVGVQINRVRVGNPSQFASCASSSLPKREAKTSPKTQHGNHAPAGLNRLSFLIRQTGDGQWGF
jgi:hypothetical protein